MKTFLEPLSAKEEKEYIRRMKEGDISARNSLIEHNLRLVAHIAKKYQSEQEDMEDLISIGIFGLMKAVMSYDDSKGSKLATYSARCIENELLMYFRSKKKRSRDVSLYEQIGTDKEGNPLQLVDIVEAKEQDVIEKLENLEVLEKLSFIIPKFLSKREQFVIIKRFGLNGQKAATQNEVAKALGISRSYVSRLEKQALKKLRKQLKKH